MPRSPSSTRHSVAAKAAPQTGFSFALAGVTRTDDAVWFASRSGGAEHAMKRALKQGGDNALNVYSTSGGAYLGWAYLPEITDTAQDYLDGIVLELGDGARRLDDLRRPVRPRRDADPRGRPLAQPRAHVLSAGATRAGDFVDDTPAQKVADVVAARPARTPARRPASTRSTTTWTTRTTPATRSSPPARCSGCATRGSCTGRRRRLSEGPGTRSPDAQRSADRTCRRPARRRLTLRAPSPIIRRLRRGPSRLRPLHLNN